MAGKNNGLDAIMAMMALKTLMNDTKDLAIHPFTIEVTVTPGSIGCSASGNRKFLEDLDGGDSFGSGLIYEIGRAHV